MKKVVTCFFILSLAFHLNGQSYKPSAENLVARERFQDLKFGLFIHWGIYSQLGSGEWVMFDKKIPHNIYKRLTGSFYPEAFNAKEWVGYAKSAGMKYITFVSRHHDGFSMFHSKATSYNIVEATPYHKDPLMELARECSNEKIDLFIYYSLLDWGRSDYGYGSRIVDGKPIHGDWNSYLLFMRTQLTELITNYPGVKGIWLDGHWERKDANWRYEELYKELHQLNSALLITNNHHLIPFDGEDFQVYERDLPGENLSGFSAGSSIGRLPLETCETLNKTWGYNITDRNFKSAKQIIDYLVKAAGRNTNLLLNAGPMADGRFQPEFVDTLRKVGEWMSKNGESIYGTRGGVIPAQPWGVVTQKNDLLYVHVLNKPDHPYIFIPGLKEKVIRCTLLNSKDEIKFKQQSEGLFIYLKNIELDSFDTIIQLSITGETNKKQKY